MRFIKNIVLVLVVMTFTMNAYTAVAMSLCNCAEMTKTEMSDEKAPCHEMAKADMDMEQAVDQDQQNSAECNKCSCGHCKVPSQASLLNSKTVSDHLIKSLNYASDSGVNTSAIPYGIDYPPKYNS